MAKPNLEKKSKEEPKVRVCLWPGDVTNVKEAIAFLKEARARAWRFAGGRGDPPSGHYYLGQEAPLKAFYE